jgi:hypothetical protein
VASNKILKLMNCTIVVIRLIGIICITGILSSCKDKAQEQLSQESSMRLEQQNAIAMRNNQMLWNSFSTLIDDDCKGKYIGYLGKDAGNFYQRSAHFLEEIKTAKELLPKPDIDKLYENYSAFQIFYHQLKKSITDSFKYFQLDSNINGFMNLDEKGFVQKYFTATKSSNLRIQLRLLEADALLNESVLLENIINYMTPTCNFDVLIAIATSDYRVYKKGDKLKITSFLEQYDRCFKGYAIIDGQKIEPKDGSFNYSRTITESPGIYKVPIKITEIKYNRQQTYPAEVTFKVE